MEELKTKNREVEIAAAKLDEAAKQQQSMLTSLMQQMERQQQLQQQKKRFRSDYNQGLQSIIGDQTKFKQLKEDQTLK